TPGDTGTPFFMMSGSLLPGQRSHAPGGPIAAEGGRGHQRTSSFPSICVVTQIGGVIKEEGEEARTPVRLVPTLLLLGPPPRVSRSHVERGSQEAGSQEAWEPGVTRRPSAPLKNSSGHSGGFVAYPPSSHHMRRIDPAGPRGSGAANRDPPGEGSMRR